MVFVQKDFFQRFETISLGDTYIIIVTGFSPCLLEDAK
jgi:hypothetical protein